MFPVAAAAAVAVWILATPSVPVGDLVKLAGEREAATEAAFKDRACTMTIDAKELDKKGATKDHSEIVMSRKLVDGKPQDELVRYVENGKDVTEEKKSKKAAEKKDEKKADEKDDDGEEIRSPFHPELASNYEFEDLGTDSADPSLRRIGFKPKKSAKGDELMVGDASIAADGHIASIREKPAELPPLVSAIDIAMSYGEAGEIRRLEMKGEGGLLFIKKRFHIVTTFDWP